ncbi:type II CRISPR RNA-guided endonuclease Cas9 [Aliarcobacter butzleri]|jgi:CRISPR-associated endonuclease Csn1|uniref:type II CRISPR RNA-guided endonuclease Cas9 n=1 Tax=Aliarcobacter butzleri TaxID=28197 RepID=UPI001B603895|nr:type II CRISPR RNA-guided endonuclease Cas9 [Aliarcobacter butzleri]MBP7226547.1 type II CRISPR RNA-guided endonuclease Cas9 [Aliarcobacter sp.]MCG3707034.1 type II CRISPR RNA-guided endonuclease Cas9 [Aliarcobacter butzleri]MCG3709446.1 type II CRISPR RNA-guided endonuclease Cas9 [Aliarcobacter butzleri]
MKKLLSINLGITSIGYSVLNELDNDKYSLIDYGVNMFDTPYDKDGNSKKLIHSQIKSTKKLYELRKERKKNLSKLFEDFGFAKKEDFLNQEKENLFINKWGLRAKKAFEEKLTFQELFSILYLIAKHRGYKSLDTDDLLEEFCEKLGLNQEKKKDNGKDNEKGKIKQALKTIETLKLQFPQKTIPQIIYEVEIQKENPTFRNHDNYNYMIRREYINEEIKALVLSQEKFGLFDKNFDSKAFIEKLIETIDDQKESSNDLSLFGNCEYLKNEKVAHQYSLLGDIYKMYQSVANITFNSNPTIKISKEQIKLIANDFFDKLKNGKNISDIKYKEIRKILKLSDDFKIFNKEDSYKSKDKTQENSITKFHFVNNLSKFDKDFIKSILEKSNKYDILKEVFDVLRDEKQPKPIYDKLNNIFSKYDLIKNESIKNNTILELIKNKTGSSLSISHQAMINIIPYFEDGSTIDEIKQKLNLSREEDYLSYKKGIKYLSVAQFENNNNLPINNHPVKYVVSAALRLIKHLHVTYGAFDEIRVESTRELSLNDESKRNIDKVNRENEAKITAILENIEYQQIAQTYGKKLEKYARKILIWDEQERFDIYNGKSIGFGDIFSNSVDIDHIVPQSLGGLSVKHNLVLVHRDTNLQKLNQLPLNFIADKQGFIDRIEYLFKEHKISWKKRKNLLATNLDDTYKDTFESKSLRATSYIEALTAQILKSYYPFPNQTKNSMEVRHIQGRTTSNIRKLLKVKTKIRNTNIHHAIDAILIGLTNQSWLQELSNTFRENMGVIDDVARQNIKKVIPLIEGIEPKELIEMIENNYNAYGEDSIFYKDIFGKTKAVNFWVSKKPMVSKIHKDTIYSKKPNDFYTVKENILNQFIALKVNNDTKANKFYEDFKKNILEKMYVYKTNPNDVICKIVQNRAYDIKELLTSFETIDKKDKEALSEAKQKLDTLIHNPLLDNNNKPIRKVKFYQTNLTGFNIRGGLATKEKTFIGFKASLKNDKLFYERIDVANKNNIKDNDFLIIRNNLICINFKNKNLLGFVESFDENTNKIRMYDSRYPKRLENQPERFKVASGKGRKEFGIAGAIGIIKLNLDILGNINSYQIIGTIQNELYSFFKKLKNDKGNLPINT